LGSGPRGSWAIRPKKPGPAWLGRVRPRPTQPLSLSASSLVLHATRKFRHGDAAHARKLPHGDAALPLFPSRHRPSPASLPTGPAPPPPELRIPQLDLALVVSLVRPRPRNPSHCRPIWPSLASASIAVGRGGAATAVSVCSPSPLLHLCRLADAVSPRTPPRLITAAARPRDTGRTSAGPSTAATPPLASTRPWPNQAVESAWLPARCRAPPAAPQWRPRLLVDHEPELELLVVMWC
jgi:hypothetical protein